MRRSLGRGFVQPGFPTISDIAVDDSALGGFVERGNERAMILRFCAGRMPFGEGTQLAEGTAITQSATGSLTGAFGG